ncbi:hypothetical protein I316_01240 [Kwoniella heveanensis BCC8398]|uniref:Uncharacterized protein n=1 Tax=Kwoniella heveanensis BCC8398 TaxID=1296120 RepID=A0A1B9H224_9TREE|nr:hypothetical protein I316_01240 [Kwoniella heveanensis BCC8398]
MSTTRVSSPVYAHSLPWRFGKCLPAIRSLGRTVLQYVFRRLLTALHLYHQQLRPDIIITKHHDDDDDDDDEPRPPLPAVGGLSHIIQHHEKPHDSSSPPIPLSHVYHEITNMTKNPGITHTEKPTHTFNPASPESVYSLSMVLLDPPAPAARADDGRAAAGARRLTYAG